MRLHYIPGSAALAPHATLAEIGIPYELVPVHRDEPGVPTAEYLALNPWGKVPTLEDGDLVLTESAAICLYLAEKFPDARLAPPTGTRERAELYRWLLWLSNTVQMTQMRHFYPERYGIEGVKRRPTPSWRATGTSSTGSSRAASGSSGRSGPSPTSSSSCSPGGAGTSSRLPGTTGRTSARTGSARSRSAARGRRSRSRACRCRPSRS